MAEKSVFESATAKINLALAVGDVRADGYHEVRTIMQSLALADEVSLEPAAELRILVDCPEVPADENNLAVQAALLMSKKCGHRPNVRISLRKRIPLAAGLAGGSADAAAVMRGLNRLWRSNFSAETLEQWAGELGADVPFCVRGGTVLAEGRGDILRPLPDLPESVMLLLKPEYGVAAAWAYSIYERKNMGQQLQLEKATELLKMSAPLYEALPFFLNDLETPVFSRHADLAELKAEVKKAGAFFSQMSGSGPTVFALFPTEALAAAAQNNLRKHFPGVELILTRTKRRSKI